MITRDSKFYSKISKMRKTNVGGQSFKDPALAKAAQLKSAEKRKLNAKNKNRQS